jgi:hypothetical protein
MYSGYLWGTSGMERRLRRSKSRRVPRLLLSRCQVQLILPMARRLFGLRSKWGHPQTPRPANLSKPGQLIWPCLSPPSAAGAQSSPSLAAVAETEERGRRSTLWRAQAVAAPSLWTGRDDEGSGCCSPAFTAKLAGGRRTIKLTRR